ncbi:MAG: VWA domain-containing protein [Heyndrickxia sp.]
MGRFLNSSYKIKRRKMVRFIKHIHNYHYYKVLDSIIDKMMLEGRNSPSSNQEKRVFNSNNRQNSDPFTSLKDRESSLDTNFYQMMDNEQKSSNKHTRANPPESSTSVQDYIDQWIEEMEREELRQNNKQKSIHNSTDNIAKKDLLRQRDSKFHFRSKKLDELMDDEIDHIKDYYLKTEFEKGIGQIARLIKPEVRRKNIDPFATVKKGIARSGGNLSRFYFKKSPTVKSTTTKPINILFIGDVSGSMGKFVVLVLYFISVLENIAHVDSYIFSDTPTYVTPYITKNSFRIQYDNLRKNATSWEYGTKLNLALEEVIEAKKYKSTTIALLLTDGGISLEGNDLEVTVKRLSYLKQQVQSIFLISPNDELIKEGEGLAKEWKILNYPFRSRKNFITPYLQKLFRYGTLHQFSDKQFICQNVWDIENIIHALLE